MQEVVKDIWSEARELISKEVSRQNFDTWIRPVRLQSIDGTGVTLSVPNRFFKEWLHEHYFELLTRVLKEVLERDEIALSFQISKGGQAAGHGLEELPPPPALPAAQGPVAEPQKIKVKHNGFNPKYTFCSFVVGKSNEFAHAAAKAVAENPARAYNPLFVYGGVGLGKTHLLQAICAYIKEHSPKTRITFLTSEEFTNELISSIHYNRMTEFRNKYRNTDLLVIDDIQFIAGKERTQEEFFHTFNTLHEYGKQIVMSSDRFPKEMPDMEERLRSRFEWGLIADIQPPDMETKAAIVAKKAEQEGITVPEDVAMFLANNIKSNVRELEGSLIRLGGVCLAYGPPDNAGACQDGAQGRHNGKGEGNRPGRDNKARGRPLPDKDIRDKVQETDPEPGAPPAGGDVFMQDGRRRLSSGGREGVRRERPYHGPARMPAGGREAFKRYQVRRGGRVPGQGGKGITD